MDPLKIIERFYRPGALAHRLLVSHSRKVAEMALATAAKNGIRTDENLNFLYEAAMLHDIGIFLTDAPGLGCFGDKPYICHGYLGRELLEKEGLPGHALVAERHVGVGLTAKDIAEQRLPLPERDMTPRSTEEIIICLADKFYSKGKDPLRKKTLEEAREQVRRYGQEKLAVFDEWLKLYNPPLAGPGL